MAAPKKSINLLTAEIRPQSQWDRIYAWTANTAKYIIIITELIVLGAIAYRFVLDSQISALDSEIEAQKELLDQRAPEEARVRELIVGMKSLNELENDSFSLAYYYTQLQSLIPPGVNVRTVTLDISSSAMSGQVTSYDTLLQLENNLKSATETFSNVTVSANQTAGSGINFSVNFKIKVN